MTKLTSIGDFVATIGRPAATATSTTPSKGDIRFLSLALDKGKKDGVWVPRLAADVYVGEAEGTRVYARVSFALPVDRERGLNAFSSKALSAGDLTSLAFPNEIAGVDPCDLVAGDRHEFIYWAESKGRVVSAKPTIRSTRAEFSLRSLVGRLRLSNWEEVIASSTQAVDSEGVRRQWGGEEEVRKGGDKVPTHTIELWAGDCPLKFEALGRKCLGSVKTLRTGHAIDLLDLDSEDEEVDEKDLF